MDILERLDDLHEQATKERTHYYVARVVLEAKLAIQQLRDQQTRRVQRPIVTSRETDDILEVLGPALLKRVHKHGPGAYAGPHETLGILQEEFWELQEAVKRNDAGDVWGELLDIAVGAVFGMASLYVTGHLSSAAREDKA